MMKLIRILFCVPSLMSCSANHLEKDMDESTLLVRGSKDFENATKNLPISVEKAEELILLNKQNNAEPGKKVFIGPVVAYNGKEYLLESPNKAGEFKYKGVLINSTTGEISKKSADNGKTYKLGIWLKPYIWSK